MLIYLGGKYVKLAINFLIGHKLKAFFSNWGKVNPPFEIFIAIFTNVGKALGNDPALPTGCQCSRAWCW